MAIEEDYADELLDEEIDDLEDGGLDDENRELIAGISGWGISLVAHGMIAFVLMYIYILGELERERPPIRLTQIDPPPEQEDREPPTERSLDDVDIQVEAEVLVDTPVVTDLDLPVEEFMTEDDVIAEVEEPRGREEAVSDAEAGGTAAFMAIGAGGGAKGAFGNRRGGGRRRAIGQGGGSRRSEAAVEASLRWFRRHQSPNGMWSVAGYPENCPDNPKCEPGQRYTDSQGDVASTGYAILCFLGAGYDHRTPNRYRTVVANGLEWLRSQAGPAPTAVVMFGGNRRMYHNAVAALAIAEAYAMTNDPGLRGLAQDAIDFVVAEQQPDPRDPGGYPLGWNYTRGSGTRNDSSVSGWAVMALKAGESGGLNVGNGMVGAKEYLIGAWRDANPHWQNVGSEGMTLFPYTWNPQTGETNPTAGADGSISNPRTVCVGGLIAVFLDYRHGDPMLESMLNTIMARQKPTGYPTNTYYLYYNTLAVFQAGGDRWQEWNAAMRDMLVDAQRPAGDGCFDGSWDWEGTRFHGHNVGRLVSTAYNTLCLQVYYRYARVMR